MPGWENGVKWAKEQEAQTREKERLAEARAKLSPQEREEEDRREKQARLEYERWLKTPAGRKATEQQKKDRIYLFLTEVGIHTGIRFLVSLIAGG